MLPLKGSVVSGPPPESQIAAARGCVPPGAVENLDQKHLFALHTRGLPGVPRGYYIPSRSHPRSLDGIEASELHAFQKDFALSQAVSVLLQIERDVRQSSYIDASAAIAACTAYMRDPDQVWMTRDAWFLVTSLARKIRP